MRPKLPAAEEPRAGDAANKDDMDTAVGNVMWVGTLELEEKLARSAGEAYAVFFCSSTTAALAGEGAKAWETYRRRHGGAAPDATIFEAPEVLNALQSAGLRLVAKLPLNGQTTATFQKLGAAPNTLIIFASDGQRLATFSGNECNPKAVTRYVGGELKLRVQEWKRRKDADAARK